MPNDVEFRRRSDALVYRFRPCNPINGYPAWKREDFELWLAHSDAKGWAVIDSANTIFSRPWNVEVSEQGATPPEGEWISKKADRAYVYDLVFLPSTDVT